MLVAERLSLCLDSRVLTQLAKIKEIGGTSTNDDLPSMQPVEIAIRPLIKTIGPVESVEIDN